MPETKTAKRDRETRERAARNRYLRAEELREKLKAVEYLRQWEDAQKRLVKLSDELRKNRSSYVAEEVASVRAEIAATQAIIDLNAKRLNKLLPDLKSTELTDPTGTNPLQVLADAMLKSSGGRD